MLVRTEFCETLKKAKIILRYQLQLTYYRQNGTLDLGLIAKDLREVEYYHINPDGAIDMRLSVVTPIPSDFNTEREWLVVELIGGERDTDANWTKFLAKSAARIMEELSPAVNKTRVATVEYSFDKRFIVMDDSFGSYDESDYITVD